jgi:hypothetical protein
VGSLLGLILSFQLGRDVIEQSVEAAAVTLFKGLLISLVDSFNISVQHAESFVAHLINHKEQGLRVLAVVKVITGFADDGYDINEVSFFI